MENLPILIHSGKAAAYWYLPNLDAFNTAHDARGGYPSLSALMTLKGEGPQSLAMAEKRRAAMTRKVCKYCGSDDVTIDAMAKWHTESRRFEISAELHNENCHACGEDGDVIDDKPLGKP